jgi:hypothetical protein
MPQVIVSGRGIDFISILLLSQNTGPEVQEVPEA